MSEKIRRATIYFEPALHQALRVQAAETEQSISDLVNEAVRRMLAQDASDLALVAARKEESLITLEYFQAHLRERGKL